MIRNCAGEEGIRRIERHIDVPRGTYDSPDSTVLYKDNYRFFALAADTLGHRSISLNMQSSDDARNLGLYGQYLLGAPDLSTGLRRTVSMPRLSPEFSYQTLELDGDFARFGYRCVYQGSKDWRHQADLMITYMIAMFLHFSGDISLLDRVELTYPRGAYVRDMEDRFGVPVLYEKGSDAIVFDRSALDRKPGKSNAAWTHLTARDVELEKLRYPAKLPDQIRLMINRRLLGRKTDLEGLALRLDTGPRTIQRKLAEVGTSYRELVERERKARAMCLLGEGVMTIDQVAVSLGYASRTQFIRAFKGWTGVTPRKQAVSAAMENEASFEISLSGR
ncbi:helix-turn-helix domain-containing protein [Roseibium alexandrii]|uniref:Virulence-regulating protein VirS n=1 Tax=Roseibium alexandrii TaxID=388408 RepID=A0A0M7ANH4_9HYPH|nr:AraC family transcriptional regulator [Roseibium alexandrii]CTQ76675.1 Virulence-regulating protein VirS [Roseibium alexandrii]